MHELEPIEIGYTNHRGEYGVRRVIPLRVEYRKSEYHGPGLHHILFVFDLDRQAERDYLITNIGRK